MRAVRELPWILLVEDDPQDVEMTLDAFRDSRLANKIVTVRDGAEALDYLYSRGEYSDRAPGAPGVVLLDLKLPKVDGIEVLRTVKGDARLKTIPVVVVTSSREERDLVRSYQLGVNSFVVKPVEFSTFTEAVKQLGLYWAVVNEPPPLARDESAESAS
jgi:CheY-like chemotaxis protein